MGLIIGNLAASAASFASHYAQGQALTIAEFATLAFVVAIYFDQRG